MKIMKTFVGALSVLVGAMALSVVVGCDNNYDPPHECSFSESWTSDEENHWHACVCGEKSGVELHSWNDGEITKTPSETEDGIKTFECKICKAQKNIPIEYNHVHSYTVTKSDGDNHWKECKCWEKSDVEPHSFGNFISTDSAKHWKECSCGRKSEEAAHSFGDFISTDSAKHWKECSCGRKSEEAAHSFGDFISTDSAKHWKECSCGRKSEEAVHDFEWKYNDTKHWQICATCGFKGSESDHDEAVLCTCGREKTIDEIPFKDVKKSNPPKWLYGTWTCGFDGMTFIMRFDERGIWSENVGDDGFYMGEDEGCVKFQEKYNSTDYVFVETYDTGETYEAHIKKVDATSILFTNKNLDTGDTQGPITFTKE